MDKVQIEETYLTGASFAVKRWWRPDTGKQGQGADTIGRFG